MKIGIHVYKAKVFGKWREQTILGKIEDAKHNKIQKTFSNRKIFRLVKPLVKDRKKYSSKSWLRLL